MQFNPLGYDLVGQNTSRNYSGRHVARVLTTSFTSDVQVRLKSESDLSKSAKGLEKNVTSMN